MNRSICSSTGGLMCSILTIHSLASNISCENIARKTGERHDKMFLCALKIQSNYFPLLFYFIFCPIRSYDAAIREQFLLEQIAHIIRKLYQTEINLFLKVTLNSFLSGRNSYNKLNGVLLYYLWSVGRLFLTVQMVREGYVRG